MDRGQWLAKRGRYTETTKEVLSAPSARGNPSGEAKPVGIGPIGCNFERQEPQRQYKDWRYLGQTVARVPSSNSTHYVR